MIRLPRRQDWVLTLVLALASGLLWLVPKPELLARQSGSVESAVVTAADNADLQVHGLLHYGPQLLQVRLASGPLKGRIFRAVNELRAQMELDKLFAPGDRILVVVQPGDVPETAVLVAKDFDRTRWLVLLGGAFCIFLCWFGGWVGAKALFSFVLSCLVIWKAVIPLVLRGVPAAWTIFGAVVVLTAAIQFLVAGLNRKGVCAFAGAISGVLAGLLMAHLFAWLMRINGAVLPYAQTLYYSGYEFLDLQDLFVGAMILASSGAVMDLAMDIASGVEEVARHNPGLSGRELIGSGMRIGQSVVGTMTTTLLLAYSGGYVSLLMMFSSQGTSLLMILNNPLVAAEAVKTLIGSFALVLVAPFTAFFSGWLLRGARTVKP